MTPKAPRLDDHIILTSGQFDLLLQALKNLDFEVLGPTLREGAIVYGRVASSKDLPEGWTDEQEGGKYRLKRREDSALFGYSVGPATWKKFLFPPVSRLWKAERRNGHFQIVPEEHHATNYAFVGVRACDIQALAIQDKVFLKGPYVDAAYQLRRANVFIVKVLEETGDGAELLEAWKGADSVFLVDAVQSGAPPGTIHRLDARVEKLPTWFSHSSTHSFGVAEAIELARTMGELPDKLVVYGIEGLDFSAGTELSPDVAEVLPAAANLILQEILHLPATRSA